MNERTKRPKKLSKIIEAIQYSKATHDRNLRNLIEQYNQEDALEFYKEYLFAVCQLFPTDTKTKNPYVHRILEFLAKFAVTVPDGSVIFNKIVADVLRFANAELHDVRYHICVFIKFLLLNMDESVDIDEELYDAIINAMCERVNDIKPTVRLEAVQCLQRLQNPHDPLDPVTLTYCKSIPTEANSKIRKCIIKCIGPGKQSVPLIIERCLDKDISVQLEALDKMSRIPVRILKLEQRQFILRNGFSSGYKNPTVKKFVEDVLVPRWLGYYNGDYFEFLKALKFDANEEEMKQTLDIMENVLDAFFKKTALRDMIEALGLNEETVVPLNEITVEKCVYWRCLAFYIQSCSEQLGEECEDQVIPDLPVFVKYTESYVKTMKTSETDWGSFLQNQVLGELLKMFKIFDMLDEKGRQDLKALLIDILTEINLTYTNIALIMKLLEILIPSLDERSIEISFIISNIREPLQMSQPLPTEDEIKQRNLRLAPLRVKLNILNDDLENAVDKKEFKEAQQIKNDISKIKEDMEAIQKEFEKPASTTRVMKSDASTISKCLDILIALLRVHQREKLTGALRTIMDQFIKKSILEDDPVLINLHFKLLKCYALFCCLDKKEAIGSIQLFCSQLVRYKYNPTHNPQEIIVAAETIMDFLLLYGGEVFGEEETDETSETNTTRKRGTRLYDETQLEEESIAIEQRKTTFTDFVEIVTDMLDDASLDMREVATEIFIRMITNDIIQSPTLFSKLILKWFNPATAKDVRLRQLLGIFFPDYIRKVPGSLEIVEKAFMPTLGAIVSAPRNSPLIDVDVEEMLKFLVELSRPHLQVRDKAIDCHKNLIQKMCNEICSKPSSECTGIYLKALLLLELPYDDSLVLEDVKKQAAFMLENITEKNLNRSVQKFIDRLNGRECVTNNETGAENSVNLRSISLNDVTTISGPTPEPSVINKPNGIAGKRKRGVEPSRITSLHSIVEANSENGSVNGDDMTIDTASSDGDVLEPRDFSRMSICEEPEKESTVASTVAAPPRRSLRKTARRK